MDHHAQGMRWLTVDTAHLLTNHDRRGTIVGAPDPRNGETVPHTGKVAGATGQFEFLLVNDVGVVIISCANDGMIPQTPHRIVALGDFTMLHEPSRRFGAEEDADAKYEGGDEGRTELKAPGDITSVFDNDVGAKAQKDTWERPLANDRLGRRSGGAHLRRPIVART